MVVNSNITLYHRGLNETSRLETYTKYYVEDVWCFGGKGAGLDKGFENANDLDIRIEKGKISIDNISIGDLVIKGKGTDITKKSDLNNKEVYTITSIKNNDFGNTPHIHLGAK